MNIKKVEVGFLSENCYILEINNTCLIVDPGDEADKIKDIIKNNKVLAILITHYHFDHIGALDELKNFYNVDVIDYKSNKNQIIGDFKFEIIDTKGHKEDAVTYYFKDSNVMFSGDFIFEGSIGRCDLEGGDFDLMLKSIELIKTYDSNIILYPGHGNSTTLANEIKNNIYFKGDLYE